MKQFYILLIAVLSMNCAVAQWEWQNPLPQGNSLNSVFFPCADTGFVVGDYGVIMKTFNAGIDWEMQELNDSLDFYDVFFTDSQNGFIGGGTRSNNNHGILLSTCDGGITWSEVNIQLTSSVTSIHFPNSDTGYAVGLNNIILKTIDRGLNWFPVAELYNYLNDVFFINGNTGFIASDCCIFKTTDGGFNWTSSDPSGKTIYFINDSLGFAASDQFIYKTTDGGINWTQILQADYMHSLYFLDSDTGYAVGEIINANEGFLMKTTDSGNSWQMLINGGIPGINAVFFTGSNIGYIAGAYGSLNKTANAGISWEGFPDGVTESLKSVCFTNENIGFAVGDHETILKTSDAGANWTIINNGTDRCMNSVYFTDATTGYIVGEQGIIYKTVDEGTNWYLIDQAPQDLFSVYFPSVTTGYAVGGNYNSGEDGIIIKTTDSGEDWTTIKSDPDVCYKSVFFTNDATGFVVGFFNNDFGNGFISRTTDGGQTWLSITTSHQMYTVYFTDSQTGYAAGRLNIYKTTNGGIDWIYLNHGQLYDIQSIYFPTKDIGYAANYWGVGKTNNGGLKWELDQTGTNNWLNSVYFTNDSTGYVVGDHGTILKTTNGGGSVLSVMEIQKSQDGLSIYPNPASGSITINTKFPGTIQILSLSGQELMQRRISGTINTIEIGTVPKGIYLLRVIDEKGVQVGKFIKQ